MEKLNKRICLITGRHETCECNCTDENYSVSIININQNREALLQKGMVGYDYCVIDQNGCKLYELKEILASENGLTHLICMSDGLDPEEKSLLLKYGIVDVIQSSDTSEIIAYIKNIETGTEISSGKFIILEDNVIRRTAIDRIISRFGYTALYAKTSDEMQQCVEQSNVQYILLNLGIDYGELNSFVRTYSTRVEMRRIPVVSYTDMSEGVFIHDVIRGLNKLTRFVLNPVELYSFLVDEMFKKDVIPLLDSLNISLAFKEYADYARESLKRIYYINEGNLFHSPSVINSDNITNIHNMIGLMNASLSRISGLKWLVNDKSNECVSTCGVSAANLHHL